MSDEELAGVLSDVVVEWLAEGEYLNPDRPAIAHVVSGAGTRWRRRADEGR